MFLKFISYSLDSTVAHMYSQRENNGLGNNGKHKTL